MWIANFQLPIANFLKVRKKTRMGEIGNQQSAIGNALGQTLCFRATS
jgi:hypothetical protein